MTGKRHEPRREEYGFIVEIPTRWSDNDMFGHINNVQYYRFFEVVVVRFLAERAKIDIMTAPVIPYAAESLCRFRRQASFPDVIEGALKVEHLGNSSVRWGLALFRRGDADAVADGHWVHVFVDRESGRPLPIPGPLRETFEALRSTPGG
ncbi:MAG: acyl-CoA thioesterase [Alphaproteobacteria bacterium]|nr:acyl-CoA thioesterase [Alphaproteobacteria bacterium]